MAVPDDGAAVTHGAAHTFRPTVLAHQREALGVIQQAGKVDQIGCRHDKSSSHEPVSYSRFCSRTRGSQPNCPVLASPPRNPIRATQKSRILNHAVCSTSAGDVEGVQGAGRAMTVAHVDNVNLLAHLPSAFDGEPMHGPLHVQDDHLTFMGL
jgi:hypothetical protein